MSRYLLSAHTSGTESRAPMTDDQVRDVTERVHALEREMKAAGALLLSGRLQEPATARVVRVDGGKVDTTDGPFAEAKEALGGFYVIEAPDLQAALEWASKTSELVHAPIEVRPFWDGGEG